jgi:hypothetical protein
MTQIPVLSGIYTDENSDFRNSYPRNLIPVPKDDGISKGYLRPADGIVELASDAPGFDRGAINWEGVCYRSMGSKLVSVSSTGIITEIGEIANGGQSRLDYSFDYLGVSSNEALFLYDGLSLKQVTDPDLGPVVDFMWIDGYFMSTDGENLIVTELNDPFAVNPLKYGSSEVDPDPIVSLQKLRNQAWAINRFTCELFQNIGGLGFPFQRIQGAQIPRGAVGTFATALFMENIAFIGSGRNEAVSVWMAAAGQSVRISTREIDQILLEYTEEELADIVCETRVDKGHQFLYIHLPNKTVVYDGAASRVVGTPIWFTLGTSLVDDSAYRARNMVRVYDKWLVGDPFANRVGYFSDSLSSHWGEVIGWQFGTLIIYNEGLGAIFHELELVCLTGRVVLGDDPTIWMQYSLDGEVWSQERGISAGKRGQRNKRLVWLQAGNMNHWRMQRFRGTSDSFISVARLEAQLEGLNV